jgi:hypothetical protein
LDDDPQNGVVPVLSQDSVTENDTIALPTEDNVTQNGAIALPSEDSVTENDAIALPSEDGVTWSCAIAVPRLLIPFWFVLARFRFSEPLSSQVFPNPKSKIQNPKWSETAASSTQWAIAQQIAKHLALLRCKQNARFWNLQQPTPDALLSIMEHMQGVNRRSHSIG